MRLRSMRYIASSNRRKPQDKICLKLKFRPKEKHASQHRHSTDCQTMRQAPHPSADLRRPKL